MEGLRQPPNVRGGAVPLLVEAVVEDLPLVGVEAVAQRPILGHLVERQEEALGSGKAGDEQDHLAVAVQVGTRAEQRHLPRVDDLVKCR